MVMEPLSLKDLIKAQSEDDWCCSMDKRRLQGEVPSLVRIDGVLCFKGANSNRTLIPASLRSRLVEQAHNMAHLGVKKVTAYIQSRYAWPTIAKDCRTIVLSCFECLQRKTPKAKLGLLSSKIPSQP